MAIIKLTDEGQTHTMDVAKCEVVQGQYGEQVKFTGTTGDLIFLPRESADRQLVRCSFGDGDAVYYSEVDGHRLTFSRTHNPKKGAKPYWDIFREEPAKPTKRLSGPDDTRDVPPPTDADAPAAEDFDPVLDEPRAAPGAAAKPSPAKGAPLNNIEDGYRWAWGVASKVQGAHSTPEAIQSGAATLLIAAQKAGAF